MGRHATSGGTLDDLGENAAMTEITGARRVTFTFLLAAAMAAATFGAASVGILATFIIGDLGISRAQLGVVIAVHTVFGALLSPVAGPVADRIGGKRAILVVFALGTLTFLVFGVATSLLVLVAGSLIGAMAEASCNPATNKLIAEDLPPGERGVVTGIKQSGVQAGIFLGGITTPTLAILLGWRGAYLVVAAIPAVLAIVARFVVPSRPATTATVSSRRGGKLPASIRWLAVYGFLLGFAGAVTFFVPLYVEEVLGFDPRVGGLVAAVMGFVAVVGRIWWSRHAEATNAYLRSLGIMAVFSVVSVAAFWGAAWLPVLVWLGALLTALGSSSWNSVGMLAVMAETSPATTGRASGIVLFGFLAGLGAGPPIFGALVDRLGTYTPMWVTSFVAALLSLGIIAIWRRTVAQGLRMGANR